ncbi:MAG: NrfD/PsrC family molybdoenzyme membrane anchor subunit [Solirubrobacteraceae bacterium]
MLARRAWALALLGVAVSPPLLISDLRPARFLNMLRMLKVTSPMSVGSWILMGAGTSTAIAAAHAWTGLLARPAKVARPAAALLGLPLCTYTGALVANTAVPVWHEARRLLPFLFGAGAALSAGAAATAATSPEHARSARRLALAGVALEVGLKELMERRLGEHAEPYAQGAASRLGQLSRACALGGAGLLHLRGARSRPAAVIAGGLLCTGAMCVRWSVFEAGVQSRPIPSTWSVRSGR